MGHSKVFKILVTFFLALPICRASDVSKENDALLKQLKIDGLRQSHSYKETIRTCRMGPGLLPVYATLRSARDGVAIAFLDMQKLYTVAVNKGLSVETSQLIQSEEFHLALRDCLKSDLAAKALTVWIVAQDLQVRPVVVGAFYYYGGSILISRGLAWAAARSIAVRYGLSALGVLSVPSLIYILNRRYQNLKKADPALQKLNTQMKSSNEQLRQDSRADIEARIAEAEASLPLLTPTQRQVTEKYIARQKDLLKRVIED